MVTVKNGAAGKGFAGSQSKHHTTRCHHCERIMNNFKGGYSRGWHGEMLCYPNEKNRPDCYKLVTVHGHSMPCDRKKCYEAHPNLLDYIDD